MCQERPDRISKWRDHLISNKIKYQGKQILLGIESSTERKKEIDCCCCSEVQPCLTFCDPMECNTPVFPVLHYLLKFAQIQVHWISDAIQPSYPLSLLLLPSIFPTIRVFPNELAFCIRWPKCWSFSFSTSPSNEYSGLNSLIFIFFLDYFSILYLIDNSNFFFFIVISKLSSPNFILKYFWLHSVICLFILLLVWITVLPY